MGYMRHHAIVVSGGNFGKRAIHDAWDKARRIFPVVSGVLGPAVNDTYTFLVPPDGSKEGWDESDEGDSRRDEFVAWLESQAYEDLSSPFSWVEVQYGDDNGSTRIVRDSDQWKRETP